MMASATSSLALIGAMLCHFTPWRSENTHVLSSGCCQPFAVSPISVTCPGGVSGLTITMRLYARPEPEGCSSDDADCDGSWYGCSPDLIRSVSVPPLLGCPAAAAAGDAVATTAARVGVAETA